MLYDTQSALPLAVLGHLHYDSITDLAWSSDGQYLAISSRDCYCRCAAQGVVPELARACLLFRSGLPAAQHTGV